MMNNIVIALIFSLLCGCSSINRDDSSNPYTYEMIQKQTTYGITIIRIRTNGDVQVLPPPDAHQVPQSPSFSEIP